jgi:LPS sulfotransferase NodH
MAAQRRKKHARNTELERLLAELDGVLAPVERSVTARFRMPENPVVLVVGPPRSGTTLLMQWLASTGRFAYPTNLLSRFYSAPWIGAKIQQLLTDPDYDFRGEMFDLQASVSFESSLGKARGALAPHEFWYFWRRFLPNEELRHLSPAEEAAIDGPGLAAGLAALEDVLAKPLALKGMIVQYNIPAISRIFDRVLFLHVMREPFYNVQSLLEARQEYYGTRDTWYSAKPEEYEKLVGADCYTQVAGQVHYTHAAIEDGASRIDPARSMRVRYETLCDDPAAIYAELVDKLAEQQCVIDSRYTGPGRFESTNTIRCDASDRREIERACSALAGGGADS